MEQRREMARGGPISEGVREALAVLAEPKAERKARSIARRKARVEEKRSWDTNNYVAYAAQRWQKAFGHDVPSRPVIWEQLPVQGYEVGRATVLDLDPGQPTFQGHEQIASYLARYTPLNTRIKEKHQVAHIHASWQNADITDGEATVTAQRLIVRLGIEPAHQPIVCVKHHDTKHSHIHLLVGRVRDDGGAWTPGLGIDRAMALETKQMAEETGKPWQQLMVDYTQKSGIGAWKAEEGQLQAEIRYRDGSREVVPWQGPEVTKRWEANPYAQLAHAGPCIVQCAGDRSAKVAAKYVTT